MGHHTEITEIHLSNSIKTPKNALEAAIEEVRYNNGANMGINAGDLRVLSPRTQNEFYEDEEDLIHLGEYSIVAPIIDESVLSRRTVRKTLSFTGKQWEEAKGSRSLHSLIAKAAAQEVTLRQGERVETVNPNEGDSARKSIYAPALTNGTHIGRSSRLVTHNTEGKAVTRYAVLTHGNRHNGHRELWSNGFPTQAGARKYMIALLDQHADSDYMDEAEIIAVTRRESGDPLVVSRREVSKVKVNVLVEIVKVPTSPKISRYRVSFDVHT